MKNLLRSIGVMISLVFANSAFGESTCSYDTYQWNTKEKRAMNYHKVVHPYEQVSDEERDSLTGCTVCNEDQVEISIPPIKPFYMCKVIAPEIEHVLAGLISSGEVIVRVTGYRVGKTRGVVDELGNRTMFSNHSYGVAIDINPEHNGLYDQCVEFNKDCRLIRGGLWKPLEEPESIQPNGLTVRTFKELGYLWGGEIVGRQKDFMHFSLTGYNWMDNGGYRRHRGVLNLEI